MLPHCHHPAWACFGDSRSVAPETHQGVFGQGSGSGRGIGKGAEPRATSATEGL
ncbi:hypothetical protein IEO21_10403 [Rhodonia placenta]|uniref:Uncharacterized protein n=1 Tax=Rhodonia placenta TaxID=104341 RepID=A0A8H7TXG2_9APHY|nr:hypothetical protein IEO21_10403 [Postia placenta]